MFRTDTRRFSKCIIPEKSRAQKSFESTIIQIKEKILAIVYAMNSFLKITQTLIAMERAYLSNPLIPDRVKNRESIGPAYKKPT